MTNGRLPDGITIRRCAAGDRQTCALLFEAIMHEAFPRDDPASYAPERFEQSVHGEEIWVAATPAAIVGFVSYWTAEPFVHLLIVAAAWRRAGIGGALLRRVVTAATGPVDLKCRLDNPAARCFYEKLGWRQVGRDTAATEPYIRYRWEPAGPAREPSDHTRTTC